MFFLGANPVFAAYQQSDWFGKVIFFSLFLLSLLTWTLFLVKWRRQKEIFTQADDSHHLLSKIRQNPLGLELVPQETPFYIIYKILKQSALELIQKNRITLSKDEEESKAAYLSRSDIELIEGYAASSITQETKKLEKNLFLLSTVVTLAPFLGLLGTVWGILLTFAELQSGASANANAAVMGGLAMALGTTVVGLIVAIPALVGYNYLKAQLNEIETELEGYAHHLLSAIEYHYRKVDIIVD